MNSYLVRAFGILLLLGLVCQDVLADPLAKIHQRIRADLDNVKHLSADQFNALDSSEVVVFDVREEKEYRVSRLDNAIQVSPDISAEDFLAEFGDQIGDKKVVFYCSVGWRSSKLIDRIESEANPAEYNLEFYNLTGGIFRWVNDDRELTSDAVHPYSIFRARLIEDKDKIRYSPIEESKGE